MQAANDFADDIDILAAPSRRVLWTRHPLPNFGGGKFRRSLNGWGPQNDNVCNEIHSKRGHS